MEASHSIAAKTEPNNYSSSNGTVFSARVAAECVWLDRTCSR